MCFKVRDIGSGRVLQAMLVSAVLASSIQAAVADPVVVPSDTETTGIEARNDLIRVGDGAIVNGDIDNRNGAIQLGDNVRVDGSIESRNGAIAVGDELIAGDISNRNGGISLGDGSQVEDVENRNGSIVIGQNSQAGDVSTRNGSIRLEAGAMVDDVETRNGRIVIEPQSTIKASVKTRNGKMSISGASVAKDITSRNGAIELADVNVGGNIRSHNGKINVAGRAEINGDVVIDLSEVEVSGWSMGSQTELEIVIAGDTQVAGSVVLKLPREDQSHHTGRIVLGPNASVVGNVVVSQGVETELRGEVGGGLMIED